MKTVAIVGKPNVGKSKLFNRLSKHKAAIYSPQYGVTRDRIKIPVFWLNRVFELIDTGGIVDDDNDQLQSSINYQSNIAISEADLILFTVSYIDGVDMYDRYIAKILKKQKKAKVILTVNKAENFVNGKYDIDQFWNLGFSDVFFVSGEHGVNIGKLLDHVIDQLDIDQSHDHIPESIKFCLIGKVNVGKSSLMNAIVNDNRSIVSSIPGTTRDAIDCHFRYHNKDYILVDTAGIRRASQISSNSLEFYSSVRTSNAIKRCNVILLVVDVNDINHHDTTVGSLAYDANIPTIIVVNKWDSFVNKDTNSMNKVTKKIRDLFPYLSWAPVVFVSALKKERIHTIFEVMEKINDQVKIKIPTSSLNSLILKVQSLSSIPSVKGEKIKISYGIQVKGQIPTFVFFCNNPQLLHFSYARYIENQIRVSFGLDCTPITIYYKTKSKRMVNA